MTFGNAASETITSDPVIVEVSDAEKTTVDVNAGAPADEKTPDEDEPTEQLHNLEIRDDYERSSYRQPARVIYPRNYSRSRSPPSRRRPTTEVAILTNTTSLNNILDQTDACIETIKGQLFYVTTHSFHSADLQKLSWLFQLGVPESWIQKPTSFLPGNGVQFDLPRGGSGRGRNDFYDDGYDMRYDNGYRGGPVPIARLGAALRIFKDDADPLASKVKFVTVVQVKNDSGWVKLVVSHSRQAAAADICHEILNNHSIIFVGAVLRNVAVPAENPNKKARKLQRVGSIEEAEEVDQGVIGVIC